VPDTTAEPIADPRSIGLPDEMRRFDTVDRYPNKAHALKFKFQNALPRTAGSFLLEQSSPAVAASIESAERLSWNNNYFLGNDESKWAPDCGNYQRLVLKDVWEGVDVQWRGVGQSVEFDFVVTPGADASQIRVECLGLTGDLEATADGGELLLSTSLGFLRQALPEAFQIEPDGSLQEVKAEFKVEGGNTFGVSLPEGHDPAKPLVIDPLIYCTYLGTTSDEYGRCAIMNANSEAVVMGVCSSDDFPVVEGCFQREWNGDFDLFVTKMNTEGSGLIFSTYIGGNSIDDGMGMIKIGEDVAITGYTCSDNFPTTRGAYMRNLPDGTPAFVLRLRGDGSSLIFSTLFGADEANVVSRAITLAQNEEVVITGEAFGNIPITQAAFQRNNRGEADAFVTRFRSDGSSLVFSSFLGGSGEDIAYSIASGPDEDFALVGGTRSEEFPTTDRAVQREFGGGQDAFIAYISGDGRSLGYGTYLGGVCNEVARSCDHDGEGGLVVGGYSSGNFPTTDDAYQQDLPGGGLDGFIVRLNPTADSLFYSTYLGVT